MGYLMKSLRFGRYETDSCSRRSLVVVTNVDEPKDTVNCEYCQRPIKKDGIWILANGRTVCLACCELDTLRWTETLKQPSAMCTEA